MYTLFFTQPASLFDKVHLFECCLYAKLTLTWRCCSTASLFGTHLLLKKATSEPNWFFKASILIPPSLLFPTRLQKATATFATQHPYRCLQSLDWVNKNDYSDCCSTNRARRQEAFFCLDSKNHLLTFVVLITWL